MKNKHLSLNDRVTIQMMLDKKYSIHAIAKRLGKSDSTISREIIRNRYQKAETPHTYHPCSKIRECEMTHICGNPDCKRICTHCLGYCNTYQCPEYVPELCKSITNAPYVCNGCDVEIRRRCYSTRYIYDAYKAHAAYENKLRESRQGVTLSPEEMSTIDNIVSPLLLKGHSIQAIYMAHKNEIPCSARSLYNYVDGCYLTARNIDLPRKVRYKARYKHGKRSLSGQQFCFGRTYNDFKDFMKENGDFSVCEMDTVIGSVGGKVLLTLLFRSCSFMMAFLLRDKSQESVISTLNGICSMVGIETFRRLFGVILTDRGTEFSNPLALECDEYGEIKTHVFYCDAYCSWQKGMIEKNHEFIRCIIRSGRSFDALTQDDITLMMNHINSYPRRMLDDKTPFDLAELSLGKDFLNKFGFERIPQDEILLKPALIKKPKYTDR
ncbi:MAG: IS30 family transposase [Lachnospiraceae bacterium]|nr:IS30 family transposase [Lachnospiraceae bacterium]